MNAGKLIHRVAVQANTPTVDANGERTNSWATLETVWGAIEPLSAGERMIADQQQMKVSHRITIRYRSDLGAGDVRLHPKHRFLYDSRTFDIKSIINPDEHNMYYICLCEETE